jgi:hypothetical protein
MSGRVVASAVVALAMLAPACGGGTEGSGAATTTRHPGAPAATAGESLATYARSGGLAGRRFEVVVRPDGTFESTSGSGVEGTSAMARSMRCGAWSPTSRRPGPPAATAR